MPSTVASKVLFLWNFVGLATGLCRIKVGIVSIHCRIRVGLVSNRRLNMRVRGVR